jgi:hypothetical protein
VAAVEDFLEVGEVAVQEGDSLEVGVVEVEAFEGADSGAEVGGDEEVFVDDSIIGILQNYNIYMFASSLIRDPMTAHLQLLPVIFPHVPFGGLLSARIHKF